MPDMSELTTAEQQEIEGGGWGEFFTGLACGATVVGAALAWASPEPLTKVAAVELTIGAVSCVGSIAASI
jgi:hypothetical protein